MSGLRSLCSSCYLHATYLFHLAVDRVEVDDRICSRCNLFDDQAYGCSRIGGLSRRHRVQHALRPFHRAIFIGKLQQQHQSPSTEQPLRARVELIWRFCFLSSAIKLPSTSASLQRSMRQFRKLIPVSSFNTTSMRHWGPTGRIFCLYKEQRMTSSYPTISEKSCSENRLQHFKFFQVCIRSPQARPVHHTHKVQDSTLPSQVDYFHSLVPLDVSNHRNAAIFGYPSWVYKAISSKDGNTYALRRLEGRATRYRIRCNTLNRLLNTAR